MNSVGQELKKERELRGISLKEIADTTKINIRYLRALEEDKFDMLPGKFFIKSIIKSYAGYIGLEEETILDHFHHTLQQKKEEKEEPPEEKSLPTEVPRKFKLFFRAAGYAVIFIIAAVIVIFLVRSRNPVSVDEVTLTTGLPSPAELPSPVSNNLISNKKMFLEMMFQQKTWIEIFSDGELYFTGLKFPGDQISTGADKTFVIHVGNAGGFTYRINGTSGVTLGQSGQVIRNLRITYNNYEQFLEEKQEPASGIHLSN